MSALPATFDAVERAQLEGRIVALKARSAALRVKVSRARVVTFAPVAALAALIAYGALGTVRLRSVHAREVVVLDQAGLVGAVLKADDDSATLQLARGGDSSVALEATSTGRRLMVLPRGTDGGFGATVGCTQFTTDIALDHLGGRDDLLGYLSVSASVSASITVQAAGRGFTTLSSSIDYGRETKLQLVQLDKAGLDLTVGAVPRIEVTRNSENKIELSLFDAPVLSIGGILTPNVRLDTHPAMRADGRDIGEISLFANLRNGPVIVFEDKKEQSSVNLGDSLIVSRDGKTVSPPVSTVP